MNDHAASSLDSLETPIRIAPPVSYRDYRASFQEAELAAARSTYLHLDLTNETSQAESLDSCRSSAFFYRNIDTGEIKVISSCCRLRWCPFCSQGRKWRVAEEVTQWVRGITRPKMLTLTFKHSQAPLDHQLKDLYACFRKFRLSNYIRTHVRGGVWFFQIKKSSDKTAWHPHLHCLIDSSFLDQHELSRLWGKITHGSSIVDIRSVYQPNKVADYVSRYAAKPAMLSDLSSTDRIELVTSLHSRRMVGTWGSAHTLSFRTTQPADASKWKSVGSYSTVSRLYFCDDHAHAIFDAWKKAEPLADGINVWCIENWIDGRGPPLGSVASDSYKQLSFTFMLHGYS